MTTMGFSTSEWAQVVDQDTGAVVSKTFWDVGGSGYYRIALPAMALQAQGYDVAMGELCSRGGYLGIRPFGEEEPVFPEVIVMQRFMLPELPSAILQARANGQVVISDVDDLFHGLHPSNRAASVVDRTALDYYAATLEASDLVTVSTPYLAKRYQRFNECIVVVPNAIDLERWSLQPPPARDALGWVGATPWRSNDLETLRRVGPPWRRRGSSSAWTPSGPA
jgi:hypothetical protein